MCRLDEPEGFGHRRCVKSHNVLAEFEQYLLEHEHGSSAAQDGERLPGKQGIRYSSQGGSKQRLNGTLTARGETQRYLSKCSSASEAEANRTGSTDYAALGRLAQQSSEGDDGGHAGTVEEEEGGHTLEATGITVVRQVVGHLPLDVQKQAPEPPAHKHRKTSVPCAAFTHHLAVRRRRGW